MHILFPLSRLQLSQEATRRNIDNSIPASLIKNAEALSQFLGTLNQAVYQEFGVSMTTSSIFRCPLLNTAVGGAKLSEHTECRAADTEAPSVRPYDLALFYQKWLTGNEIEFNQIILEFGAWVHVSISEFGKKGKQQTLTAVKTALPNGIRQTNYLNGLKDIK